MLSGIIYSINFMLLTSLSALEKKRKENCSSEAVKKRPCLTIRLLAERSLDALSETKTIFSFLSTAAAKNLIFSSFPSPFGEGARRAGEVFVYFLGL